MTIVVIREIKMLNKYYASKPVITLEKKNPTNFNAPHFYRCKEHIKHPNI